MTKFVLWLLFETPEGLTRKEIEARLGRQFNQRGGMAVSVLDLLYCDHQIDFCVFGFPQPGRYFLSATTWLQQAREEIDHECTNRT